MTSTEPTTAPIHVSSLGASLVALSHAQKDKEGAPTLIPGFFFRSVSTGGLINTIYSVVYYIIDTYFRSADDSLLKEHLEGILESIKASFAVKVEEVKGAYAQYEAYLNRLKNGETPDAESVVSARYILADWNNSIRPSKGMTLQKMIKQANATFLAIKESKGLFSGWDSLLQYDSSFEQITGTQAIIELEENLGQLPLGVCSKLCNPNPKLDVIEASTLKQWIAKINGCWRVDVHKLHRGLRAAMIHLKLSTQSKTGKPSKLAILETNLRDNGLLAMTEPDGKHLSWRRSLGIGSVLSLERNQYTIQDRSTITRTNGGKESYWSFPIVEDESKCIIVGENEVSLGLQIADEATGSSIAPYPKIYRTDRYGRFGEAERIATLLDQKNWTSSGGSVSWGDSGPVRQIEGMLKKLAAMEETPIVEAADFGFNASNELKLRHPLESGEKYDFPRIVRIAFHAANGNLTVYKRLLKESGLSTHVATEYYQDVVEDVLKEDSRGYDVVAVVRSPKITDAAVRAMANELSKSVKALLERCSYQLKQTYIIAGKEMSLIREALVVAIVNEYRDSIGAGMLWPGLDEAVVNRAATKLQLNAK